MKQLVPILLATFAAQSVAADQTVSFNNNNLGRPELVTFGSEFGALAGSGVRNGVADGANFVAQLNLVAADGRLIPAGRTANFRASTTALPGTWSGGTRTIAGVPQGTPINLKVRVWDSDYPSFEAAAAANKGTGESAVFSFQDPLNNPLQATDNFMFNFRGFSINKNCPLTPSWFFTTPNASGGRVHENELWDIPDGTTDFEPQPVPREDWYAFLRSVVPPQAAALGGSLVELDGRLFYRHAPNTYGYVNFFITGQHCDAPFVVQMAILSYTVLPSPKRPCLALNPGSASTPAELVLRGLAPNRYRVEKSADLAAWQPVGEFVANYSEVPVQALATNATEVLFFRAVELGE